MRASTQTPIFVQCLRAVVTVTALALALAACKTPVHAAVEKPVDPARADECQLNCERLGMRLSSVVLIMNHAGCVCEVRETGAPGTPAPGTPAPSAPSATRAPGAAAASGAATIGYLLQQAAQRRQDTYRPQRR